MTQNHIHPGNIWLDTAGNRIQAHGGAIFYENDRYYWYGENKEKTDGKNGIWTYGIRAYSSTDLYNWKDEGLLIPPVLDDPNSSLAPCKRVDRPHIVKNASSGKYVCWLKLSGEDACFVILTADTLLGEYTIVRDHFRPLGQKVGDFDILQRRDGSAYLYFDGDHSGINCVRMTDDYLNITGSATKQYANRHPPFSREGIAVFEREGKIYMFTSGQSGYIPNQSDVAIADTPLGPFIPCGDPHVDDASHASFNSQISQVFKLPGRDICISLADRWVPQYPVDAHRADLFTRAIAAHFEPERYQITSAEREEMRSSPMLASANTSIADYVWLPVNFRSDIPIIKWQNQWNIPDAYS